jgi:hypothetical protein
LCSSSSASIKILPAFFAWSAGWGDIAIGVTAPFAALRLANPAQRKGFIFWQVLGITDLVNALALGTLAGVIDPHGIPTGAMTVLPMSYISTFAVPLFFILHIICIAQAAAGRRQVLLQPEIGSKPRCPRGKNDRWGRGSGRARWRIVDNKIVDHEQVRLKPSQPRKTFPDEVFELSRKLSAVWISTHRAGL